MRVRLSWDEGWSGRYVHKFGPDDPRERPQSMTVEEPADRIRLWIVEDGETIGLTRRGRIGFSRGAR